MELVKKIFRPKKKKKKTFRQYSKTLITAIAVIAVIWISISYVMGIYALIAYASTDLLSDLSEQVCITLLGAILGYLLKAFAETYSEKKNELDRERMESSHDDSDAVG